jgi:ADP-ribose pyrophosphatase
MLGERVMATGVFLELTRHHLLAPDGRSMERDVIRHPGAVAVVPLLGEDVVLIRQHRSAVRSFLLEIPAGKLDIRGEDPAEAARRECVEEVGLQPRTLEPLCEFFTAPGFTDERIALFLAQDPVPVEAAPVGAEEEVSEIIRLPLTRAIEMIGEGEIVDAKTQIGLLMIGGRR